MGKYKKLYFCFIAFISLFIFTNNVHGATGDTIYGLKHYGVRLGGTEITGSSQHFLNGGLNQNINVYGAIETDYGSGNDYIDVYVKLELCLINGHQISSYYGGKWLSYPTGFSDIEFLPTSIKCGRFPNYPLDTGYLNYFFFKTSQGDALNEFGGTITYYSPTAVVFQLSGLEVSLTPFDKSGIIEADNQAVSDQQIINNGIQTNQKLDTQINQNEETNNTIKDSNSDEATSEAGSFFSGFETDTFGLTSIVTAPLNLIESITSSTCVPMGLPIPFIEGQTLNLPCLRGIYENNFGTFYDIYKTITFGIVAYYVCVKLFNLVKDFKNPEHDEIEVLEL